MTTNTNAAPSTVELQDMVSKALRRAWHLGQTYWQKADSEFTSQHRKADETQAKFDALVEEMRAVFAAAQPHVQISPENVHIDCDMSIRAEKVDTSAAPKTEPDQQPDLLTRIKELERERDHALMAAEAEAREVDRLRAQPERVPLSHKQALKLAQKAGIVLSPAQFSGVLETETDEYTLVKFAEMFAEAAHGIQPAHKEQP